MSKIVRGPNDQKKNLDRNVESRSKFSISTSKNRAAVGGPLEIFNLARNLDFFDFSRGPKLNTNIFFSNFSGTTGISEQNPGISRQKCLISLVSRDIPNFLAPTPSCGRPPPHRKISGLKVWVWAPLSSLIFPPGIIYGTFSTLKK